MSARARAQRTSIRDSYVIGARTGPRPVARPAVLPITPGLVPPAVAAAAPECAGCGEVPPLTSVVMDNGTRWCRRCLAGGVRR